MSRLSDERGTTLVELLVVTMIGSIVFMAALNLADIAAKGSTRATAKVAANQQARPLMQKVTDMLASSCIAPGVAPIQSGDDNSVSFLHATGSDVGVVPSLRTLGVEGTRFMLTTTPSNGGAAPAWTFDSAQTTRRELAPRVDAAVSGGQSAPYFRFYAYENGVVASTPLPTPLSTADAARAVEIEVSFAIQPPGAAINSSPVTLSTRVPLRFSPATDESLRAEMPCE